MKDTVLLFESRDLCYESNRYFMECIADVLEEKGFFVEICDLSVRMEQKLEDILQKKERYLFAVDFNSLLPRIVLEDGTPYLDAFDVLFFNYLVDHPLYHHAGLKKKLSNYSVICIDACHLNYLKRFYPHIEHAFYLPLGAVRAGMERSFDQKRLELLFLGTYEREDLLYEELKEYPKQKRREVSSLIEMMRADPELTQEDALLRYFCEQNEALSAEAFAKRLNEDYLADKYLRNWKRKEAVLAAAKAEVPFTVMGHGWEHVKGLEQKHVKICGGVGFAASIQMMANAKMLLNTTPGFHGGLHDRVYSAMMNHTLCFSEYGLFAGQRFTEGKEIVFYDGAGMEDLPEKISYMHHHPSAAKEITERAFQKVLIKDTWESRVEELVAECRKTGSGI